MPAFVVLISLLSLLSLLYSAKVCVGEAQRLQLVGQPFGGSIPRMLEQVLRFCLAAVFTSVSFVTVLMSAALVWLSMQPGILG